MKIKHKVQRKLNPTFQAELKLCSLCGPTTWWQRVVCAGSGDGPWHWFSGAHLRGQRRGGRQRLWPPAGGAVLLPETRRWWERCQWGRWVLWLWGWASRPPSLQRPPQKSPQAPGSLPLLSEPCIHSACVRASFGFFFFISDCCAQDCESEKPLRSRHRCKRTRVYLQAQACVQVHPDTTEQGLGPRSGF